MPCPPPLPSTGTCPLCGQANQCAMAAGRPPQSCWCMRATMDSAALERLPTALRGTACVCPTCGTLGPGNPGSSTDGTPI